MNKNSMLSMVCSLGIITVLTGLILGVVNYYTKDAIDDAALQTKIDALADILPEFDNNPLEQRNFAVVNGDTLIVYAATKEGEPVGVAVESPAHDGFSGDISLMFGFNAEGAVSGFKVLAHSETPGLGAKMEDWFRDSVASRSVIGRNIGAADFSVTKDGGEIDGITAATITSRAFLGALRRAAEAYRKYVSETKESK